MFCYSSLCILMIIFFIIIIILLLKNPNSQIGAALAVGAVISNSAAEYVSPFVKRIVGRIQKSYTVPTCSARNFLITDLALLIEVVPFPT